jgi:hypothetical protein
VLHNPHKLTRSPLANPQLDCFTGVRNDDQPVIASEREAIQLISASSLPSQTCSPLANHQLDYVAPARNDGPVITEKVAFKY